MLLHPWDFPGENTGVGCHFLLQEIFPTQGLKPGLPHCRQMLYHLSHQGSHKEESETARKFEDEWDAVTCHGKEGVLEILLTAPIASLFTQFALLTEPGVGNVQSKSLEGDLRSHRNCTYFYSLPPGMAAVTQPLSWLTQQPKQRLQHSHNVTLTWPYHSLV